MSDRMKRSQSRRRCRKGPARPGALSARGTGGDCAPVVRPRRLRILVVEDEAVSAEALTALLSGQGTCVLKGSAEEGLAELRLAADAGCPFNLVCLDVRLPGMSGLDALRAIRAWESDRGVLLGRGVPVIMTTVCRDPHTVFGAFNSGCEQYLVKPIGAGPLAMALVSLGLPRVKEPEPAGGR